MKLNLEEQKGTRDQADPIHAQPPRSQGLLLEEGRQRKQWRGHRKLIKRSGVKDTQCLKAVLQRQNSGEEQEKGRVGRVGSSSQTTKNLQGGGRDAAAERSICVRRSLNGSTNTSMKRVRHSEASLF